jgi:inner membrane protein
MDTITHSLLGALTIRAGLPRSVFGTGRGGLRLVVAGGVAAAFPDIDYLTYWIDPLSFISDWHRAATHSLVLLPVWAILLGSLFAALNRDKAHWRAYVLVSAVALFSAILSDTLTAWGTEILWPVSDYRAAIGTTFVIDPWFTGIIALSLAAAIGWHGRHFAQVGIVVLLSYVGFQGLLKHEALGLAQKRIRDEGLKDAHAAAFPQPLSPFNWKLIITAGESYHVALVNLLTEKRSSKPGEHSGLLARVTHAYQPRAALQWNLEQRFGDKKKWQTKTKEVWWHDDFARFRRFARLPVLYRIDENPAGVCIWFTDLRYILPGLIPPFRYGMCADDERATWHLYRLRRGGDERQRLPVASQSAGGQSIAGSLWLPMPAKRRSFVSVLFPWRLAVGSQLVLLARLR